MPLTWPWEQPRQTHYGNNTSVALGVAAGVVGATAVFLAYYAGTRSNLTPERPNSQQRTETLETHPEDNDNHSLPENNQHPQSGQNDQQALDEPHYENDSPYDSDHYTESKPTPGKDYSVGYQGDQSFLNSLPTLEINYRSLNDFDWHHINYSCYHSVRMKRTLEGKTIEQPYPELFDDLGHNLDAFPIARNGEELINFLRERVGRNSDKSSDYESSLVCLSGSGFTAELFDNLQTIEVSRWQNNVELESIITDEAELVELPANGTNIRVVGSPRESHLFGARQRPRSKDPLKGSKASRYRDEDDEKSVYPNDDPVLNRDKRVPIHSRYSTPGGLDQDRARSDDHVPHGSKRNDPLQSKPSVFRMSPKSRSEFDQVMRKFNQTLEDDKSSDATRTTHVPDEEVLSLRAHHYHSENGISHSLHEPHRALFDSGFNLHFRFNDGAGRSGEYDVEVPNELTMRILDLVTRLYREHLHNFRNTKDYNVFGQHEAMVFVDDFWRERGMEDKSKDSVQVVSKTERSKSHDAVEPQKQEPDHKQHVVSRTEPELRRQLDTVSEEREHEAKDSVYERRLKIMNSKETQQKCKNEMSAVWNLSDDGIVNRKTQMTLYSSLLGDHQGKDIVYEFGLLEKVNRQYKIYLNMCQIYEKQESAVETLGRLFGEMRHVMVEPQGGLPDEEQASHHHKKILSHLSDARGKFLDPQIGHSVHSSGSFNIDHHPVMNGNLTADFAHLVANSRDWEEFEMNLPTTHPDSMLENPYDAEAANSTMD